VEVRIGIKESPKELEVELDSDTKRDEILKQIESTLGKDGHVLWLTDKRGRTVGVPSSKIAYVEIGSPSDERRVGFAT
jgi:hypothetical protein